MSSIAQPVTAIDPLTTAPFAGVSTDPLGGVDVLLIRTYAWTNCGELIAFGESMRIEPA